LRVVFQDVNLQWSLDMATVRVVLDLSELATRTFHARSVQGEGVVFRFRHRVEPWSADEPSAQVLPRIPEFPGPAVFEANVPEAPVTDANYKLWTVHLEQVDVGVSEVWMQQFRYLGSGRARGSFRLRPARSLWVGPASLDLTPGRFTVGAHQVSSALAGRVECLVHPFDVRTPVGREVFRFISAHVRLRAPSFSLTASRLFLPREDARLRAGNGELRVDVRTDHGRFLVPSQLELSQERLVLDHDKFKLDLGRVSMIARARTDGRGEAVLELHAGNLTLPNSGAQPLKLDDVRASIVSSSVDTVAEWAILETNLLESRIFAPDVRWFNGMTGRAGWISSAGASELSARARYKDGELEGDARATFHNVHTQSAQTKLVVDGQATFAWSKARFPARSGMISASLIGKLVRLEQGASAFEARGIRVDAQAQLLDGAGRGRLTAKLGQVRARAGKFATQAEGELAGDLEKWDLRSGTASTRFTGELRNVTLRASDPELSARVERASFRARAERYGRQPGTVRRDFGSRLSLNTTLHQVKLEQGASVFEAGGIRADAQARTLDGVARGWLTAKLGRVNARAGKFGMEAEGKLVGNLEKWDLRSGTASTRFTGELRNVTLRASDPELSARVERASFRARAERYGRQPGTVRRDFGSRLVLDTTLHQLELEQGTGEDRTVVRADELFVSSFITSRANRGIAAFASSSARGFAVNSGRTRFNGSPELHVRVNALKPGEQPGRIHAELVVRAFSAIDTASDSDCPWSSIALATLRADAELRGDVGARIRLAGDLSRVKLAWGDFSTAAKSAHFETDFDEPVLAARTGPVLVVLGLREAKLRSGPGAPLGWEAALPKLDFRADLSRTAATFSGPVRVAAERVRARIGRTIFQANLQADVSLAAVEPEQLQATGTGSVRISRFGLRLKDQRVDNWWAHVELDSVKISAKDNLDVVSVFRAKLRDALPALTVLAAQGDIPGWLPDMLPLRELEATGTVARRCRITEVHVSKLNGGPLTSTGRVQSVMEAVRGAFLVRLEALSLISAGISFDEKDSSTSFFAGAGWQKARFDALDVRARLKQNESCVPVAVTCGD
jgi:hypothetical protein